VRSADCGLWIEKCGLRKAGYLRLAALRPERERREKAFGNETRVGYGGFNIDTESKKLWRRTCRPRIKHTSAPES
jgi:hypothetical protein